MTGYHCGDLDNRVHICFREYAFPASTFDVKTEDTERCNIQPFIFRSMRDQVLVAEEGPSSQWSEKSPSSLHLLA